MARSIQTPEMPRIRVKQVHPDELQPNPHNPRLLFDREPLDELKASIKKVGVLVPLTVYRAEKEKKYTILDGQRRWICAQEIGMEKVPINEVAEPSTAENIVTMFQIHKLRKDWELMPTALKLAVLMGVLKERRDRQLAELTGLDIAAVVRCKKLLWFPVKYQRMMLLKKPEDRIKADFFIELYPIVSDRTVLTARWYDRDYTINRMLDKYEHKRSGIKSITNFRVIKQHITAAVKAGQQKRIIKRLHEFLEDDDLDISHLEIGAALVRKKAARLTRDVRKLANELSSIVAEDYYGEEKLWEVVQNLITILKRKLSEADRRQP